MKDEVSFYERITLGDLKVLSVLLESLRSKIDLANLTADNALLQVGNALASSKSAWDESKKFQPMNAPTQFGAINANGFGARGTHFIFGQYSFLAYENNADESQSVVLDPDYTQITGDNLRDLEVVNRRTLDSTLSKVSNNIQGAFISKNGDTGNTGSSFTFPKLFASVQAEYTSVPDYNTWNEKSFMNYGFYTSIILPNFDLYLPLTGGTIEGQLVVNDPNFYNEGNPRPNGSVITYQEISSLLDAVPSINSLRVLTAPVNSDDVVRLADITDGTAVAPSSRYPVWTSGRIVLNDDLAATKAGSYLTTKVTAGVTFAHVAKILKFSDHAAFDNSDSSFQSSFVESEIRQIAGCPTVINSLPFPIDYKLYFEYDANMGIYGNPRRCSIPLDSTASPFSAFIDPDGDMSLVVQDCYAWTPWLDSFISAVNNTADNVSLRLVVSRWSFVPLEYQYLNARTITPAIFLPASVTFSGATGAVDRNLRVTMHDIDTTQTFTWTATRQSAGSDAGTTVNAISNNQNLTIHFPFNTSTEQITFTLSCSGKNLNGGIVTLGPITCVVHNTA